MDNEKLTTLWNTFQKLLRDGTAPEGSYLKLYSDGSGGIHLFDVQERDLELNGRKALSYREYEIACVLEDDVWVEEKPSYVKGVMGVGTVHPGYKKRTPGYGHSGGATCPRKKNGRRT